MKTKITIILTAFAFIGVIYVWFQSPLYAEYQEAKELQRQDSIIANQAALDSDYISDFDKKVYLAKVGDALPPTMDEVIAIVQEAKETPQESGNTFSTSALLQKLDTPLKIIVFGGAGLFLIWEIIRYRREKREETNS